MVHDALSEYNIQTHKWGQEVAGHSVPISTNKVLKSARIITPTKTIFIILKFLSTQKFVTQKDKCFGNTMANRHSARKTNLEIIKPYCVLHYIKHLKGVNKAGHCLSYYSTK
jgi:hypothetical protein